MTPKLIYMDYHATTPVDPRVVETMLPCFSEEFGNASSGNHALGWRADQKVQKARTQVAKFINADYREITFTAGATESNNLAIKGLFEIYGKEKNHIITQVTEHKCVLETCKYLQKKGAKVTFLEVDSKGQISLDQLRDAITDKTLLITIMVANNEIGVIQPTAEIGKIAKEKGVFFLADAAQASGRIPIDVHAMNVDLLSLSSHKLYGPKGAGCLYIRPKNPHVRVVPQIHGGGHEEGLRSGTLNVPGIVGFGAACEIAMQEMPEEVKRIAALRDRLKAGIEKGLQGVYLNGHPTERLCNNLHLSFEGTDAESLLMGLNQKLAVSSGSACSSGQTEASHVLRALKMRPDLMFTAIRFGLGRFNTEEEIDQAIEHTVSTVTKLRQLTPKMGC